jgi:hypothetical protein
MSDDLVQFKLRLPDPLRSKLTEAAQAADRSINSEILWRLELSLAPEWLDFVAKVEERERRERAVLERLRQDPAMMKRLEQMMTEKDTAKPSPPPESTFSLRRR